MGDHAQIRNGRVESFADVRLFVAQAADGGDFVDETGAGDRVKKLRVILRNRRGIRTAE